MLSLDDVMGLKEAALRWNKDQTTILKALKKEFDNPSILISGKDFKKSGSTWMITKIAMEKLFGTEVDISEKKRKEWIRDLKPHDRIFIFNTSDANIILDKIRSITDTSIKLYNGMEFNGSGKIVININEKITSYYIMPFLSIYQEQFKTGLINELYNMDLFNILPNINIEDLNNIYNLLKTNQVN